MLAVVSLLAVREDSADAKLEATLNEVFERYDFHRPSASDVRASWGKVPGARYDAEGLTEAEADGIVETVLAACQDCMIRSSGGRHGWGDV